jgi:hypothetical protein
VSDNGISLREYVDQRFTTNRETFDAALSATKEAIGKNEQAIEKRFQAVSEFRRQLEDQARSLLPRSEHDKDIAAIKLQIELMERRIAAITERSSGAFSAWLILAAVLGPIISVAIVLWKG